MALPGGMSAPMRRRVWVIARSFRWMSDVYGSLSVRKSVEPDVGLLRDLLPFRDVVADELSEFLRCRRLGIRGELLEALGHRRHARRLDDGGVQAVEYRLRCPRRCKNSG